MICKTCNVDKSKEDFSPQSNSKNKRAHCKVCRSSKAREHRADFPDIYRNYEYKKKYKIDLDIYNKVLEEQNGVCYICKGTWSKVLVVDHDHDCCSEEKTCGNCLRALLCGSCNAGLGWFKHDIKIMSSAIAYMQTVKGHPWQ